MFTMKLELESMKMAIMVAMQDQIAALDADVKTIVTAYCSDESLRAVIAQTVKREIDSAVSSEIQSYFRYNKQGHKVIKEAVLEALERRYPVEEL